MPFHPHPLESQAGQSLLCLWAVQLHRVHFIFLSPPMPFHPHPLESQAGQPPLPSSTITMVQS